MIIFARGGGIKLKLLIKKIKNSDFFTVYFFDMIAKMFTVVITILIIRCLSENDYAKYTVFNSVGSFISGVLGSGIGLAYTRYAVQLRQTKSGGDSRLYIMLRKNMILLALVVILCSIFFLLVTDKASFHVITGLLYGLVLAGYQLNIVFFQAQENYTVGGIISNVKNIVVAIVVLILFVLLGEMQLVPLLSVYLAAIILSWLFTINYIDRRLSIEHRKIRENKSDDTLKKMLKESVWIILYMFMLSAFNQIDVLILNNTRESLDVASYGVAFKYYSLVLSLLPALQVVLRVKNSSVEMTENARLRKESVVNWLKKSFPLSALLFIVGFIVAKVFFPILNGHGYNDSILIFDILLVGACLSYMTAPNVSVMLAAEKQRTLFFLSIGAFLINFIGNCIFIPKYGGIAAAFTTVLAHFFLNGGSTILLLQSKE